MTDLPDPAFLIRRLIGAAEREREALLHGEDHWEAVVAARSEFESEFARLEAAVMQRALTSREVNDLARLQHLHEENVVLARDLQQRFGLQIAEFNNLRKISGYRPYGDQQDQASRYLDNSA